MKRSSLILSVVAVAVVVLAGTAVAGHERTSQRSTADVVWIAEPDAPVGSSRLIRTHDEAIATFRTSGLLPDEAVTLWWVVFNDPAGCSAPCGENDIFLDGDPAAGLNEPGIAAADIVVGYADGAVADAGGNAVMTAAVGEGGAVRELLFGAAPLLKDVSGAEIHLVARSHGPLVPELRRDQLGSYAGGCEVFLHPPAVPDAVGECADIQFAVHLP